jgi:purine nucleosidase
MGTATKPVLMDHDGGVAVVTEGPSQGRTKVEPGGRTIQALDAVDVAEFYAYILRQWAR